MTKPFKTLDEQIKHLESSKNIVFEDKKKQKNFFTIIIITM
ncbi:MAG: hypothetical protein ACRC6X_05515 [Culicoidibacterales bacterium]